MKKAQKRRLRELVFLMASLFLIFCVLSACGSPGGQSSTTAGAAVTTTAPPAGTSAAAAGSATTTAAPAAVEAGSERVSLELPLVASPFSIHIWAPTSSSIQKTMQNLVESDYYQELEKRTGVSVQFTHPALGQEMESFNLLIASGDYPDIIESTPGMAYPGGWDKGIQDGVILRLNDLVDQNAPNYKYFLDSKPIVKKEATTDEGNIACFYSISVDGPQPPWLGLMVRKDWLDDAGLSLPVTFDDWHTMLRRSRSKRARSPP
jgi:putative aldouronate transport system substrate-binding protein